MDAQIQAKLQSLFTEYSNNLPNMIRQIDLRWQCLRADWNWEQLELFHYDVRSLCGASATYGYGELSRIARQLEAYLQILLCEQAALTEEIENEVGLLLSEMQTASIVAKHDGRMISRWRPVESNQQQTIVILGCKNAFSEAMITSLKEAGYRLLEWDDMSDLQPILDNQPAAIVVDFESCDSSTLQNLAEQYYQYNSIVPLICVSDQGDMLTRLKAVRVGCSAFFQKPIDIFHLIKQLDQLSDQAGKKPFRVLIVDDSTSMSAYHSLILQEAGMVTEVISNPLKLMNALMEFQPDLLLIDVYMPKCTGLELAAVIRQEAMYANLPIIFLSTENDRIKQLLAMKMGGDDFLVKPILPQHLVTAIVSRAKRAERMKALMSQDSLTQLLNHTAILQRVEVELSRAQRSATPMSLVIIDIDHFKLINDSYGHLIGDYILKKISELLSIRLRKTDIVGRYGGDEFALVLPNTDPKNSIELCKQLIDKFAELNFMADGKKFPVTLSMGVASYPALDNTESIIAAADEALYHAKRNGRNQVVHSAPDALK